jgi:hypothetical protein
VHLAGDELQQLRFMASSNFDEKREEREWKLAAMEGRGRARVSRILRRRVKREEESRAGDVSVGEKKGARFLHAHPGRRGQRNQRIRRCGC